MSHRMTFFCCCAAHPTRPKETKVGSEESKLVVNSEYEPSTATLQENRDAILAGTYTSSSESEEERTKKVASKNKRNYDTRYDHSDPPQPT